MFLYFVMACYGAHGAHLQHAARRDDGARASRPPAPCSPSSRSGPAPSGAGPTWGTYWVWDARLTSELVLLFLYFGFIALANAFEDPRRGDRAAALLAIIGIVNLPIIYFSVQWWNTLHQGSSVKLTGTSMHVTMFTGHAADDASPAGCTRSAPRWCACARSSSSASARARWVRALGTA